ncbi:MAG: dihydroorotase [Campylobacterota bacterium]|nr:dihydroorotase [Campylobacterota bacterium]
MSLVINSPLDMHVHLRDGEMLKNVVEYTAKYFSGALIMPNLLPPITSKEQVQKYKKEILDVCINKNFEPYMTLFLKEELSFDFLNDIKEHILAVKLYPSGVTTNSQTGLASIDTEKLKGTLEAMAHFGIPLSIHGETNGFSLDREKEFMPIFEELAAKFPKLKIIMEHISSKESISTLKKFDNLYATVTVHHLLMTLDDVIGGALKPHNFCKPILKTPKDRDAIQEAVLSGDKKIMFGSDTAPHAIDKKESASGSAGVFSAPVLLQALASFFDKHNSLNKMQDFVSTNAKNIYNINPPKKEIILEKADFLVPNIISSVVPLFAGEILNYSIKQ